MSLSEAACICTFIQLYTENIIFVSLDTLCRVVQVDGIVHYF